MQARERKQPGLPLRPGKVERREYEYIRHGTLSFIVNFEVATGQMGTVSAGPTRTEEDYVQHIQRTVEADPTVKDDDRVDRRRPARCTAHGRIPRDANRAPGCCGCAV